MKHFILTFAVIFIIACQPTKPMVIGTNTWIGYEPLYVAKQIHYTNDTSIDVRRYSNATEVIGELETGNIDMAGLTLDETMIALSKGVDLKILYIMDISDGADQVLVDDNINSLSDIKGKTIAVEASAVGAVLLYSLLSDAGLTYDDVNIVNSTIDKHLTLFSDKDIDAAISFPPYSDLLKAVGAKPIYDSSMMTKIKIIDVLAVRTDRYEQLEQQINDFLHYVAKAIGGIEKNQPNVMKIVGNNLRAEEKDWPTLADGIIFGNGKINRTYLNRYKLEADMLILEQIMLQQGMLSEPITEKINSSLFIPQTSIY